MLRPLIVFVVVLTTISSAAAQEFLVDPPQPDSATSVAIVIRGYGQNGCELPRSVSVVRSGSDIEIIFTLYGYGVGCGLVTVAWKRTVPLGILAAGVYRVRVYTVLPPFAGRALLHDRELVITESEPPFSIEPPAASISGGEQVVLIGNINCQLCPSLDEAEVFFGGLPATVLPDFHIVVPPHPSGAVDVMLRGPRGTATAVAAFRYFDRDAEPDPTLFETILVPVLYVGAGAFGSLWVTEVRVYNDRSPSAIFFDRTLATLPPNASVPIHSGSEYPPAGALIRPLRQHADRVLFAARVIELRSGSQTELPIVSGSRFKNHGIVLPEVRLRAGERATLRVYALDPVNRVTAYIYDAGRPVGPGYPSGGYLGRADIRLQRLGRFGSYYGEVADLHSLAPNVSLPPLVRVEVGPTGPTNGYLTAAVRFWGFVSIANNETHHVTLVTPQ